MKTPTLLTLVLSLTALASPPKRTPQPKYAQNEIIVKLRSSAARALEQSQQPKTQPESPTTASPLERLNARYRAKAIRPLLKHARLKHNLQGSLAKKTNQYLAQRRKRLLARLNRAPHTAPPAGLDRIYKIALETQTTESLADILDAYRASPDVEYAEFNYIVSLHAVPNDRLYDSQWAPGKMDAEHAWDVSTGDADVVVAVLDTGADYNHRDLKDNMWINQAELNGDQGIDDDGNGFIDDIYGYNFIYNDPDPFDDHGHGTHCSGIIAAVGNNSLDVTGICWNARIMALKFIGSLGEGTTADAVLAIYYAVQNGADILSNSWGSSGESRALQEALDYARSRGVIVVASAGNSNSDSPQYPAAYEHVISVAATDPNDRKWFLSNYGDWIDIAAPGDEILSLKPADAPGGTQKTYTITSSGTSMAAPQVAGACALLLSANPFFKYSRVYDIITAATDPISPEICRTGRLNLRKVMSAAVPPKGYVTFDRDCYPCAGPLGLLLADWDLRTEQSETLTVMTGAGDSESLTLTPKTSARGVLLAHLPLDTGDPNSHDGVLQVSHNQILAALYFDANDGSGNPDAVISRAHIDCRPPALLDIQVQASGPVATITLESHEPAAARILCGRACGGPYDIVEYEPRMAANHTFRLTGLELATTYYLAVELTDPAGNHTTADNQGLCHSFTTPDQFPGFRVPDVYPTIQQAIDDASDGDTVWVADGTYSDDGNVDLDFHGKAIILKSENGPQNCIIDCQAIDNAALFHNGEDPNSRLEGFTIKNGHAQTSGGAVTCIASSPTVQNCIFAYCTAGDSGAAIYNAYGSSPIIENCTFKYNSALAEVACVAGKGGAICNTIDSSPTIQNCTFTGNWANYSGGAIYNNENSNPTIINSRFLRNSVGDPNSDRGFGGAISNLYSSPLITACTFQNNSSGADGGAIYSSYDSDPVLTNCVLTGNHAEYGGAIKNYDARTIILNSTIAHNSADFCGGIWNGPSSSVTLTNSILWQNTESESVGQAAQINNDYSGQPSNIDYCCLQGWTGTLGGLGNVSLDPLFVDPCTADYHLSSAGWRWDAQRSRWDYDTVTSPCIDAGNPGSPLADEPLAVPGDPDNLWGLNRRLNMGAYAGTAQASMAPPGQALLADLNNDAIVNNADLALMLTDYADTLQYRPGDLNRDASADACDISLLAAEWLSYLRPPTVIITAPADGEDFQMWPIEIEIRAEASDLDRPIAMVEFFVNQKKVGRDTDGSNGWQHLWTHNTGGTFTITAKATDAAGTPATSPPIHITVTPPRK
ncbi:MAG: S8 family serine peptidase [Phycisphaerales bacterium]|nr:MAG: S8 family serine peptidase [Phycisphaerales bacterium]